MKASQHTDDIMFIINEWKKALRSDETSPTTLKGWNTSFPKHLFPQAAYHVDDRKTKDVLSLLTPSRPVQKEEIDFSNSLTVNATQTSPEEVRNWLSGHTTPGCIIYRPGHHFWLNCLWMSTLNIAIRDKPVMLLINPDADTETSSASHAYIPLSLQLLAAMLSGTNYYMLPENVSASSTEKILDMLTHESGLASDSSLLRGNYFLSSLSDGLLQLLIPAAEYQQTITTSKSNVVRTHEYGISGKPPFLKGPYRSMYSGKPWTIRQYAGFSTASASNAFYKENLKAGQKGLSIAFDLPTHRGYDSSNPRVRGDVGMSGVAIDTVEDMKTLLEGIPLDKMSVSMTMNGAVVPILAFFIVAAEEQGVAHEKLQGTIQNDILKEFLVRNTYIYPPEPSMSIVTDIFRYTSEHMPRFNPISISGYHMHEAGADAVQELAYTIANGITYIKAGIHAGIPVDDFAPRLSFFWGIGMDLVTEIAKLRAARLLWTKAMNAFNPQNPKSSMMRMHCQTSGWSLTAQEPENNIVRTMTEAFAAVSGHTQSLHTNALDEAIALPSVYSAKIARETQQYLQNDAGLLSPVDPWGGTEAVEAKTATLLRDAWRLIQQIEHAGGMMAAIKNGSSKMAIAQSAARRQARIDTKKEKIVGLNFRKPEKSDKIDILQIDNDAVFHEQHEHLQRIKKERSQADVTASLNTLMEVAKSGNGSIMEAAIIAARARATLGEISHALETVYGRYRGTGQLIQGVYHKHLHHMDTFNKARAKVLAFEEKYGRRPRMLIAKLGQDGHDRGAHVVATSLADIGFDIDLGPLFQTPEEVLKQAIENDVHFIGISSQAGAHKTNIRALHQLMQQQGIDDMVIIAGGIIPEQDHEVLKQYGVQHIFGPGTVISEAVISMLDNV